jgi:uncharacterized RDD family membrane protein YckC
MLVTQPGLPGPFAQARALPTAVAVPQRPASLPEMPQVTVKREPAIEDLVPSFPDAPASARAPQVADAAQRRSDAGMVRAEPAALWRRLGAWMVDLLVVLAVVSGLLAGALQLIAPKQQPLEQQLTAIALPAMALVGVLAFVYAALFAFLWNGRTPGRRLLGIYLVDGTGHAPGPLRALVRAGLALVSFGLFLAGFWLALFDRHGQTLHDKLTRTFVVRLQDA